MLKTVATKFGDVVGPASATANNLVLFDGATGKLIKETTTGTGVVTALGVNTGSAGAFVVNGGALGTPASGTVTNLTGTASININGTVGATTPTTGAFTTATLSSDLTLNGGTANGVLYLNGSKVATSGSALTFDGTNFSTTGTATATKLVPTGNVTAGNGMYLPATNTLAWSNNGAETMRLDSSGNLGLGVTPSAWTRKAIQMDAGGTAGYYAVSNGTAVFSSNVYYGSGDKYINSNYAGYYAINPGYGSHTWAIAASGTAGNAITFTQALTLDASGNLLLGGTSAGASSAASLAIFNGTAPTGSVTNGIILYAEDVSSSSELKVRDEAGNVTTLSPHNFSLIPEGPSEDMAWAYYSEKGGKRINVDMLKLARMVEKLTGEKLVYES